MKDLKVGIISQKFEISKDQTRQKTVNLIEKAVLKGANLIVLQELHQSEYFVSMKMLIYLIMQIPMKMILNFGVKLPRKTVLFW